MLKSPKFWCFYSHTLNDGADGSFYKPEIELTLFLCISTLKIYRPTEYNNICNQTANRPTGLRAGFMDVTEI